MGENRTLLIFAAAVIITSCAPSGGARPSSDVAQAADGTQPRRERVLTISIEQEPNFIAAVVPMAGLSATAFHQRMFNAFLDMYDDQGRPYAYLAESLPALNTDTWIVLPDGRMETRYRLKPNLVWHDGAPLTANDFAFTFQVATPAAGFRTGITPYSVMENVVAEDDRSFVIHWKGLYPDAGVLVGGGTRFGLVPFPRHLLEQPYRDQSKEAFQDNPFWGHEFVGAGPFKLDRWELGSRIDGVAFDQHVTGRPTLDRVRLLFMSDGNTAFANLLAETTDVALNSITFAHFLQLKREWASNRRGTADFTATSLTAVGFQLRPEYANPRAVLDKRVRQALAHGIDKRTFGETIWGGELTMMDTIFEPTSEYYPIIERAVTKYAYDPRISERLMGEAGYTKGPDGLFGGASGKLTLTLIAPQNRPELPVLAATWRQVGFDIQEQGLAPALATDPEMRGSSPSMSVATSGAYENQQMQLYRASEITSPETRWRGENATGWREPGFDRLVDAFNITMDPAERVQQRAQMAQLLTEELPSIPLSYNPNAHAFLSSVTGLTRTSLYTTGRVSWNVERWDIH